MRQSSIMDNVALLTVPQAFGSLDPGSRHCLFVPSEQESFVDKSPFPIQAVHALFKAKGISTPGDNCSFCGLISHHQVHLFGALVYFSSPSVIPAYFSLNSIYRPPLLLAATSVCSWWGYFPFLMLSVCLSRSNNSRDHLLSLFFGICNGT